MADDILFLALPPTSDLATKPTGVSREKTPTLEM